MCVMRAGILKKFDASAGRWEVLMEKVKKMIRVKQDNLIFISTQNASNSVSPSSFPSEQSVPYKGTCGGELEEDVDGIIDLTSLKIAQTAPVPMGGSGAQRSFGSAGNAGDSLRLPDVQVRLQSIWHGRIV